MKSLFSFQSIRGRFHFLGLITMLGLLIVGAVGILGNQATNASLERVYQNRLVPLRHLKQLSEAYSSTIPGAVAQMNNGELTGTEGLDLIRNTRDSVYKCWQKYRSLPLTPEERTALEALQYSQNAADQEIESLIRILESFQQQGRGLLSNQLGMILNSLDPAVRPLMAHLETLTQVQLNLAHMEYIESQRRFNLTLGIIAFVLAISIVILTQTGRHLQSHIMTQLNQTLPALQQIGRGDLSPVLPTHGNDEFSRISDGINHMSQSLRIMVGRISHGSAHLEESSKEFSTLADSIAKHSRQNATNSNLTSMATSESGHTINEIAKSLAEIGKSVEVLVKEMESLRNSVTYANNICEDEVRFAAEATTQSRELERVIGLAFRYTSDLNAVVPLLLQSSIAHNGQELVRTRMEECLSTLTGAQVSVRTAMSAHQRMAENSNKVVQSISNVHATFENSYQILQTLHITAHGASKDMEACSKGLHRIARTADVSRESAMQSAQELKGIQQKSVELKSLSDELATVAKKFRV